MKLRLLSSLMIALIVVYAFLTSALSSAASRAAGPWFVSNSGNDGNDCLSPATTCATINGALFKPGFAAGDVVRVAVGTYTRDIGDEVVVILKNALLSGGWNAAFTAQTGVSVIDAQSADRRGVYVGGAGIVATIDRFLVTNSNGIHMGGGIYNDGVLTLSNSVVRGNTIAVEGGGGIYNTGILTVTHSSIENNSALGGGGIDNVGGTVVLIDSAVVNNSAPAIGGIRSTGVVTIENSTIAGNTSTGVYSFVGPLAIHNATIVHNQWGIDGAGGSVAEMRNSIVAFNTAGDCYGTVTSAGYNIMYDASTCTFVSATGDQVGVDPLLSPALIDLPAYYLIMPGSPAIDAGNPAGCMGSHGLLLTDQRGWPRTFGRCDVGAIELQPLEASDKRVNRSNAASGQALSYTIALRNASTSGLDSVVVTDTLPTSVTYQLGSLTASDGSFGFNNGTITWTGSISAGTNTSITFGAVVAPGVPYNSTITNTAIISGGGLMFERDASFAVFFKAYLPMVLNNYCNDVFFDDFSYPASGWPVGEDAFLRTEYANGEYRMASKQSGYVYLVKSPDCDRANYVAEVDARWAGSSGDGYGLMFGRVHGYSEYYVFYVSADYGDFALLYRDSNGLHFIVPYTQSSAIHGGTATNHLKVIYDNGAIMLSVNGTTLGTWLGNVNARSGTGVVTSPYDDQPVSDVRFDNFSVTRLLTAVTMTNGGTVGRVTFTDPAVSIVVAPSPRIHPKGLRKH